MGELKEFKIDLGDPGVQMLITAVLMIITGGVDIEKRKALAAIMRQGANILDPQ